MFSLTNKKILLTGGNGFVGKHVYLELIKNGAKKSNIFIPNSKTEDLREKEMCMKVTKGIDLVIHLAGNIGGIGHNKDNPALMFYDNIQMGVNLIEASRLNNIKKFVCISTICAYPKITSVPFKEENLWYGYPDETNAPYGMAKKVLWVMLDAYKKQYGFNSIYLMPTNMYGPGDNFDPHKSHVMPALIRKIYEAKKMKSKKVVVWGNGIATREFIYVKDAAKGIVMAAMKHDKLDPLNLGSGKEISIKELVDLLIKLMNYKGEVEWDTTKPNGQPRRCLSVDKARDEFGFEAGTSFEKGLKETINWYYKKIEKKD
jgi:GDP-L-fucose synthase